jgi:biopolymer transport protein ExbB/TolQ
MSIGLLGTFWPMLLALLAIFLIRTSYAQFSIWPPLSFALVANLLSLTLRPLDANAFF